LHINIIEIINSIAALDLLWIAERGVSQQSSLHQLIGARNTGGKPYFIICRMVGGKEKAYLFIAQTGRCRRKLRADEQIVCP
jgi:hypothetical protein